METVSTIADLRARIRSWRTEGHGIAFVPTMGNLHAGHLRLVEEGKALASRVVVSIFVNPTQFGPGEDFGAYPRTPEADAAQLESVGAGLLFLPAAAEMYPPQTAHRTFVEVPELSDELCGHFRPGHFRGVATVVLKLFNQVQPDWAVFGEKDYQQLTVIRRMVEDLDVPVRIHGVPTVREADGLAMSSRNAYLSVDERGKAARIYAALTAAAEAIRQGAKDYARIEADRSAALIAEGFKPDYFAIRRQSDLAVAAPGDQDLVILVAARLGKTRLIDNLQISL